MTYTFLREKKNSKQYHHKYFKKQYMEKQDRAMGTRKNEAQF